ncbi:HNH endonuclease signature motif containing protein [Streptomyces sp. NPDC050504]|uniref:HNH endonuclease signature motif containing protein n=1 Tax=Streptomyces sp. NPDC050504 TaxID=3365618 RepID=UPI0037B867D8
MALTDTTADAVLRAAEEYDAPGRTALSPGTAPLSPDGLVKKVEALRVAHAADGPRLYQPIALLWAAGRALRGEPRVTDWRTTDTEVGDLLVRYGMRGEQRRPYYPVLALFHAGLWTLPGQTGEVPRAHGGTKPLRWTEERQPDNGLDPSVYTLLRTSGEARGAFVAAVVDRFFADLDEVPLLTAVGLFDETVADDAPGDEDGEGPAPLSDEEAAVARAAAYDRFCRLVEDREEADRGKRRPSASGDPIRSAWARRAVLDRSLGRCENPGCAGQPDDRTDRGLPLLEVDHVTELGRGGRDHPSQMVALCPNCHAIKTRGRTRHTLADVLRAVAMERHRALRG